MTTRQRESSAPLISNDGFSVVAPMSVIVPASTWGRKASCWVRLKRWISSTKRMVRCRWSRLRSRAAATISRISFTPPSTAEKGTKTAPVRSATMCASVVFPVPGGPQRMSDGTWSASMARRSALAGPSTCSWPTNSSNRRGRSRSGSGFEASSRSSARSNRSMRVETI